jgi:adenosine deaminase
MNIFPQLKLLPKVDLHINLTGSISTNLVFDLTNETSIIDLEEKMFQHNPKEYRESLKVPIRVLKTKKNIVLAINDLIDRLEKNNVIYSELFLDLPLYKNVDLDKLINYVLDVIKERNVNMNLVLCLSDIFSKEENLEIINIFEKYYNQGVNGLFFDKSNMTNISDYSYIFDRLKENNYPYILNLNSRITNQDYDIYTKAKRVIYSLPNKDDLILDELKNNDVLLEFPLSSLWEANIISGIADSCLYDLYLDNFNVCLTSRDMTSLNTDILNEYCLLFNNFDIKLLDLIKINIKDLEISNIDPVIKEKLIEKLRTESNELL